VGGSAAFAHGSNGCSATSQFLPNRSQEAQNEEECIDIDIDDESQAVDELDAASAAAPAAVAVAAIAATTNFFDDSQSRASDELHAASDAAVAEAPAAAAVAAIASTANLPNDSNSRAAAELHAASAAASAAAAVAAVTATTNLPDCPRSHAAFFESFDAFVRSDVHAAFKNSQGHTRSCFGAVHHVALHT